MGFRLIIKSHIKNTPAEAQKIKPTATRREDSKQKLNSARHRFCHELNGFYPPPWPTKISSIRSKIRVLGISNNKGDLFL